MTAWPEPAYPLVQDYEQVALAGLKLLDEPPSDELSGALARLISVGLAEVVDKVVVLHRPRRTKRAYDADTAEVLDSLFEYWVRTGSGDPDDEVLHGEIGYWNHLANVLQSRDDRQAHPLEMDVIVGTDAGILSRQLLGEFDSDVVERVLGGGLLQGRVILPPAVLGSLLETFVDRIASAKFAVRVLRSPHHVSIFDHATAVLRNPPVADGIESHRLTRNPALVAPLRHLFELQWAAAMPWEEHKKGATGVLTLLARGWTDQQIAKVTGTSVRTVSRRVSRAMEAAGVRSRFQLGMAYARTAIPQDTNS